MKRLGLLLLVWAGLSGCAAFSRRMVYFPPSRAFWPCEEAVQAGADAMAAEFQGQQVRYLWGGSKAPKGAVVFFHGNGEDACSRSYLFKALGGLGWRVALVEYPGYAQDKLPPSESRILPNALAAYDHVSALMPGKPVAVFGISLGTGAATYVASTRAASALILESPWTSLPDVGKKRYPWLPVGTVLKERFPAHDWARQVACPVLAIYGDRDWVIPPSVSLAQIKNFPSPPRTLLFEGTGHNGMMPQDPTRYFSEIARHLEAALAPLAAKP